MKKTKTIILILLLTILSAVILSLFLPYYLARTEFPGDSGFSLTKRQDGSLLLEWTAAGEPDFYDLSVSTMQEGQGEILYEKTCTETFCILPDLSRGKTVYLQVSSGRHYKQWGKEKLRVCKNPLRAACDFIAPEVSGISVEFDTLQKEARISWEKEENTSYTLWRIEEDESLSELAETQDAQISISFGEESALPMPLYGEQGYSFAVTPSREDEGLLFTGLPSKTVTVERNDLLSTEIEASAELYGEDRCLLSWGEGKGEHYSVQEWNQQRSVWETIGEIAPEQERTFTTGNLAPFVYHRFRVIADGAEPVEGEAYSAVSGEMSLFIHDTAKYKTIWPIKDMEAYETPEVSGESVGFVKEAQAYCVLDEQDGKFLVKCDNGAFGYIDSDYCMINLPEYLGDLCTYDITNSTNSIFMVHEFEVPEVTDTVLPGYEDIRLADGSYLVPLLYPVAKRLAVASQTALEEGYRLKIYEAYRPHKTTRYIYDTTLALLDEQLPEKTFQEEIPQVEFIADLVESVSGNDLTVSGNDPDIAEDGGDVSANDPDAPDGAAETQEDMEDTEQENTEPADETERYWAISENGEPVWIGTGVTYRMLVTNGRYHLNSFLAASGSRHNMGVALDLTLEDAATGEELEMQTSMHDLSWFSVVGENDEEARILEKIMTGAGFAGIGSEWWHFQDNELHDRLNLSIYMEEGVSAECDMYDGTSWRHRGRDGVYTN